MTGRDLIRAIFEAFGGSGAAGLDLPIDVESTGDWGSAHLVSARAEDGRVVIVVEIRS